MKVARGIRNNNPLNIRHSSDRWEGARIEQTDRSFVQFTSMAYGYRAAWKTLESYWKYFHNKGMPFTPCNIIHRWAPKMENDSTAYVRTVCSISGLICNEVLPRPSKACLTDEVDKLITLLMAMTCVECGIRMKDINREEITQGYEKAY